MLVILFAGCQETRPIVVDYKDNYWPEVLGGVFV